MDSDGNKSKVVVGLSPTKRSLKDRLKSKRLLLPLGIVLGVALLVAITVLAVQFLTKKSAPKLTPQQKYAQPSELSTNQDKFLKALEKFAAEKNESLTTEELKNAPKDKAKLVSYKVGYLTHKLVKFRREKKGTVVMVKISGDKTRDNDAYISNSTKAYMYLTNTVLFALKGDMASATLNEKMKNAAVQNGFEKFGLAYVMDDQNISSYDTSLDPVTGGVTSEFFASSTVGAVSSALPFGTNGLIMFHIKSIGSTGSFDSWTDLYKKYK